MIISRKMKKTLAQFVFEGFFIGNFLKLKNI